jgi:hypothetical protein
MYHRLICVYVICLHVGDHSLELARSSSKVRIMDFNAHLAEQADSRVAVKLRNRSDTAPRSSKKQQLHDNFVTSLLNRYPPT